MLETHSPTGSHGDWARMHARFDPLLRACVAAPLLALSLALGCTGNDHVELSIDVRNTSSDSIGFEVTTCSAEPDIVNIGCRSPEISAGSAGPQAAACYRFRVRKVSVYPVFIGEYADGAVLKIWKDSAGTRRNLHTEYFDPIKTVKLQFIVAGSPPVVSTAVFTPGC